MNRCGTAACLPSSSRFVAYNVILAFRSLDTGQPSFAPSRTSVNCAQIDRVSGKWTFAFAALRSVADPLKTGAVGHGENLAWPSLLCCLYSREPVVALVFPKSSRIGVRHRNRLQVLSALEPELYRNSQAHRGSPFGGERLLFKIKRQNGLRMQRARHVYTGRIAVKAGEGNITRPQIRADAAQKEVQRHTAPLPDLAPSLDTDVPGDLSLLRQAAQSVDRPRGLVRNQPGDRKAPIFWDRADLPNWIVSVEAERSGDRARRIGFGKALRIKQCRLHPIIEAQHRPERSIDAGMGRKIAAGEQRQTAERQTIAQ